MNAFGLETTLHALERLEHFPGLLEIVGSAIGQEFVWWIAQTHSFVVNLCQLPI